MFASNVLFFLLPVLSNGLPSDLLAPSPTAIIDSGPIIGTTTSLPSAAAPVLQFLGIPYAAKPTRFEPPQRPKRWSEPLRTNKWKPACIQQYSSGAQGKLIESVFNDPPAEESEDCLYMNIYAPQAPASGRGRAVMLWIYGGRLQNGHAGKMEFDGSVLAGWQDVVVVTFNYRTNVFGFPGSSELDPKKRNLGFLDQRMALDWVQRNIDVFGGDPDKVTVFGESAGAISIDSLITSYSRNSRPPFRAAILQSGQTSYGGMSQNRAGSTLASMSWAKLAAELQCGSQQPLKCMQNTTIPSSQIQAIVHANGLNFGPIVDNQTLFTNLPIKRQNRDIALVPILIGSNSQEARLFVQGQSDVEQYVARSFGKGTELAKKVLGSYPVGGAEFPTGFDAIAQISTDFGFQCSTALYAAQSKAAGIPTWRYYFNATFPNLQAFEAAGVFHSSENRLIFGTYGKGITEASKRPSTPEEHIVSEIMQAAWARFAKDPFNGPGWTQYGNSPSQADIGNIGSESSGVSVINHDIDGRCVLYNSLYLKNSGLEPRQ
ncbi:cholinesterase [Microthyrium microscopicum]|uniref:Carboxylic ester hydrolase n=1 Tax=Microthyrium microscopicum TaxID=703497 RepID=A0A6A6UL20_9PEZI|nr:cholinesterase [Microthyrium microscopicum]